MIPPFEVAGGPMLAGVRALSVAGLVAAAGGLSYAAVLRPASLPDGLRRGLGRLCAWSLGLAALGALAWLAAQTREFAGDDGPASLWAVLSGTLFGRLLSARLVLLGLAGVALWRGWRMTAAGLACLALVLQAGHSHALAMGGAPVLLASSALHVLAAGVWLGGLPGLWLVIARGPPVLAQQAARRFSAAGLLCVGVLLATASWQFVVLVTGVAGLVGTAYGWMVGAKMALFAGLIVLAARNRQRLTPRLADPEARRSLARAVTAEIALGLAVLAAAGVLTELQPAMHTQKLWPFPWLPSLDAAREDPDVAHEVALAGATLALSLLLLALAAILARRRGRMALALGVAGLAAGATTPRHLAPLLVPAVPTIFYRSPTGQTVAAILQGASLYAQRCAACHGADGRGDGPLARGLPVPPANLLAPHLWAHRDGELFWWLTHGIEGPRGGLAMPGVPGLSEDERWALIDFVRVRNAGRTLGVDGRWATQLSAPDFAVTCAGRPTTLSALRGQRVRITLDPHGAALLAGVAAPLRCDAADPGIAQAYGVAAPGAGAVLLDANGWLRAASHGPDAPDPALALPPLPRERPAMRMDMDDHGDDHGDEHGDEHGGMAGGMKM